MLNFTKFVWTLDGIFEIPLHDQYVGRSLDLYGEYSFHERDLLLAFCAPGSVVVEAGANLGAHTIALAKAVSPGGTVVAFEPQRVIAGLCEANMLRSGGLNVQVQRAALGMERGVATVPPVNYAGQHNFGGIELLEAEQHGEQVQVVTLDELRLEQLDLIKADVEGMELAVLEGGQETISRHRPVIYVEADRALQRPQLLSWLRDFGYDCYFHTPPLFREHNAKNNPLNVFGPMVSINVLAIHAEHRASHIDPLGFSHVRRTDDAPSLDR